MEASQLDNAEIQEILPLERMSIISEINDKAYVSKSCPLTIHHDRASQKELLSVMALAS
jgi:hypothetical protein